MLSLEQRVAYLEGRLEDHTTVQGDVRSGITDLRVSMTELCRAMTALNGRMDQLDGRMDQLDERMDQKFSRLDSKFDRHFTWLVGIQAAVLVAVLGTLVGAVSR